MSVSGGMTEPKVNTFVTAAAVIKFSGGSVGSEEWTDSEDEGGAETNSGAQEMQKPRDILNEKGNFGGGSSSHSLQDGVVANGSARTRSSRVLVGNLVHSTERPCLQSNGERFDRAHSTPPEENSEGKNKSSFLKNLKRISEPLSDRVKREWKNKDRAPHRNPDDDTFESLEWSENDRRESQNPFAIQPSEQGESSAASDGQMGTADDHQGDDGSPPHDAGEKQNQSYSFETDADASLPSDDKDLELITDEDLGISENHFSQPEGVFGFSRIEELEMAIENCKEAVKASREHSESRRTLVAKLVQLRLKLVKIKEGEEEEESEEVKTVLGHRFQKVHTKSLNDHCEVCLAVIWALLQKWYRCSECDFGCHGKCLNMLKRQCVSSKMTRQCFDLNICPEKGLSAQNYRCAECRSPLAFNGIPSEPRLCDYSGLYYCSVCHWNDAEVIPARVIHNWDFEPRKVCRQSKQLLRLMCSKAVLRIQDLNPMLFSYVEELSQIKKLREEILIMKAYFLSCRRAMESKLLKQLQARPHFVECSDGYSLRDLVDTEQGSLLPELAAIHANYAVHIRVDCQLCQARGFICEICNSDEVIFPFDMIATKCVKCSAVYHRDCYYKVSSECPKCARMSQRQSTDRPNSSPPRPIKK